MKKNIFQIIGGYVLAWVRLIFIFSTLALFITFGMLVLNLRLANQYFAFKMRTFYCKLALKILGVRVHQSGNLDQSPGTLYVGNHRSLVDPLVVFAYLKQGYVIGKIEVSKYPLVNTGARQSGVVYVDRDNSESRKSTREAIEELLKQNMSVLVFPEGTISTDLVPKQFRQGSFHAAVSAQKPIVVFALEMGDPVRDFWHGEGLFDLYFQSFSKWRTDVYLHFFDPIKGDSGEILAQQSTQMVMERLTEFQKNWKSV